MKKLFSIVAMCALACPVAMSFADDKGKAPAAPAPKQGEKPAKTEKPAMPGMPTEAEQKAMAQKMEEAGKPGPMHEWMKQFEGEWTTTSKEMGMDGQWSESKGTCENKLVLGGRFMEVDFKGRHQGKFFYGRGAMGYNNVEKQFESVWYDSMSSAIMVMKGNPDKDGKVLTLKGKFSDATDGQPKDFREVMTIESKDKHRQEFYLGMPGPDGKVMEMKIMEITYTKGKAADAKEEKGEKTDKGEKKKG